jgi:hypothetical protein
MDQKWKGCFVPAARAHPPEHIRQLQQSFARSRPLPFPSFLPRRLPSIHLDMGGEFRDDPSFQPWGPFISDTYKNEPITKGDIIIASIVWGLTLVNVIVAVHLIYKQTRGSRSPLKSVYVWMIWLELIVSFTMGLESFLYLLKLIRPSKCYSARLLE